MRYRTIDHTADIGIEVEGETLLALFENAAHGFVDTLTDVATIQLKETATIEVLAGNSSELLVAWLSELLFLFDARQKLFGAYDITSLSDTELRANVQGEAFDPQRHPIRHDIKAVTYHNLKIEKSDGIWKATIIFDI